MQTNSHLRLRVGEPLPSALSRKRKGLQKQKAVHWDPSVVDTKYATRISRPRSAGRALANTSVKLIPMSSEFSVYHFQPRGSSRAAVKTESARSSRLWPNPSPPPQTRDAMLDFENSLARGRRELPLNSAAELESLRSRVSTKSRVQPPPYVPDPPAPRGPPPTPRPARLPSPDLPEIESEMFCECARCDTATKSLGKMNAQRKAPSSLASDRTNDCSGAAKAYMKARH